MKSGCSVFSANFLWSAVLQHLKRWRRSMNHLLQGTCDGNWTGSDQVTWPKSMTLKKKRSGNIWNPLPAVAVTHLLCIRTTYIHLPTITCWFERSCGFPLQPSADSSSWLLTFTSSKSVHVRPMSVPSSPSLLSVFAGLRFLSGGIEFCLAGSCS